MKTKVEIDPGWNFHDMPPINVLVDTNEQFDYNGVKLVELSPNQVKRVKKHFCGMSDCQCGSSGLVEFDYNRFGVVVN